MRDILTVLAGFLILVLVAALAVPPLVDWEAHRPAVDRALSRAVGVSVATDGRIGIRLLPSPRIRVDQIRFGAANPEAPSFSAAYAKAELELAPLLRGEIRFSEARIGRAELRVPARADGTWRLPRPPGGEAPRRWAFDDVAVSQLLVTTVQPATGRTDQLYAEGVQIEAQSLTGPWRIEGTSAGVPFRLVSGELGADGVLPVKVAGGGDAFPRFDVDARLDLGDEAGGVAPTLSGVAKLNFGPPGQPAAGIPVPIAIQAGFKSEQRDLTLDAVSVEAGEGGIIRLTGAGRLRFDDPRLQLKLEGRRLDLDAFAHSGAGRDGLAYLGRWIPPVTALPVELELALASVGLGGEELTNVVVRGSLERGRIQGAQLEALAPGQTRVAADGEFDLGSGGNARGRVRLTSAASDRLARYAEALGLPVPFEALLDGRPLDASGEVTFADPVTSLRNVRVKAGDTVLTGNARHVGAEGSGRGRLEAQIGVQAIDLARLPQVSNLFDTARSLDLDLTVDARDVRHGERAGAGRIAARVSSEGRELVVEGLDIVDLAGANARVAGRIGPDGGGRIEGRITARRAAPLIDLLGTVWAGGAARLVPPFLREGELDLEVVTERPGGDAGGAAPRLRTSLRGNAAGGRLEADFLAVGGATESLSLRLATDNTGRWVARPEAAGLRRPSSLDLKAVRGNAGGVSLTVAGNLGGVAIRTTRPFLINPDREVVERGEADLEAADLTPFLALLGQGAAAPGAVPARLRVVLGRERAGAVLAVSGRVAENAVDARLAWRSASDISGEAVLERLSLPWLASALVLNVTPDPRGAEWPATRFGPIPRILDRGQMALTVRRLDLGRGFNAEGASFRLSLSPEGLALRDLEGRLAGGRLSGGLDVSRQGSLASFSGEGAIKDAALAGLTGMPFGGRLSASLRFGTSGESLSAAVSNLAGTGDARIVDFSAPGADPAGLERALARILGFSDPLAAGRLDAVLAEELGKAPLRAAALAGPATLVGGAVRLSIAPVDVGPATWQGGATVDFKTASLDARGVLAAKGAPKGWTGPPPAIGLGWRGPVAAPARQVDSGALASGLTAIVLRQELEKIEAFEADANERARRKAQADFARSRREAAEAARIRAQLQGTGAGSQPSSLLLPVLPPIEIAPPRVRAQPPGG